MRQMDFYAKVGELPFRRDLSDRARYFQQRDSLQRHLGIVPRLLAGTEILEFGPGYGENALFLLLQKPARLVLVESAQLCLDAARTLLESFRPDGCKTEYHLTTAEEFTSSDRFDLVIFEGVIPFEPDPPALLRQAARFVAPGGILSITCIDPVSLFAEGLRRLVGLLVAPPDLPTEQRVERLTAIFSPHLTTLAGMTRPHAQWVLDQLIHSWNGRPFSIGDAILTTAEEFDPHGVSPSFLTDWRWFRDIHGDRGYTEHGVTQYFANVHNLLDYRFAHAPRPEAENRQLLSLCTDFLERVREFESGGDRRTVLEARDIAAAVADIVASYGETTATGLADGQAVLDRLVEGGTVGDFASFTGLFGRGQQYLSLIRRS